MSGALFLLLAAGLTTAQAQALPSRDTIPQEMLALFDMLAMGAEAEAPVPAPRQELSTNAKALLKDIQALGERLDDDDIEVREKASIELRRLIEDNVEHGREALDAAIAKETGAEPRARLQDVLKYAPRYVVRASSGPIELIVGLNAAVVGQNPVLSVRLRNIGPDEILVVAALQNSDSGSRFPRYYSHASDDGLRGRSVAETKQRLAAEDFVVLKPGRSFLPFETAPRAWYIPKGPGLHRLRFVCDYSAKDFAAWNNGIGQAVQPRDVVPPEVPALFARVPKVSVAVDLAFVALAAPAVRK